MEIKRDVTICLAARGGDILLAMKKRGFGAGRWNGLGGKVRHGETIKDAAVRESFEEARIKIKKEDLEKTAEIEFYFPPEKEEFNQRAHIYIIRQWDGEPEETDEMRPQWFKNSDIPYAEMWPGDKIWLPRLLVGEKIKGKIFFADADGNVEKTEFQNL